MYEELVEGCGTSSGLDVTTGKLGATQVSPEGWGGSTIGKHIYGHLYLKENHLTSFLYLCSRLLVYFTACLWMKVPLSLWSITS